jgi:hypothetical protein
MAATVRDGYAYLTSKHMAQPTSSSEVSPEVKEIAKLLGSSLATWRKEARVRLRQKENGVEILTAALRQVEINQTGFIIRFSSLIITLMIFKLLMSASKWLVEGGDFGRSIFATLGAAATTALSVTVYLSVFCFPSARRIRTYGTLLLAREYSDDIRAVGPLAEGLGTKDAEIYKEVVAALTKLLPTLTEEDNGQLNGKQRTCLYRALGSQNVAFFLGNTDTTFLLSLLHAVEIVGDANALPYVQKLASDTVTDARIASPAQQCLKVLRERAASANAEQTLLRPAEREVKSPEMLLRPATANVKQTEPEILLRASSTGEAIE